MKYAAQKDREKAAKILALKGIQQAANNEDENGGRDLVDDDIKLFFKTCVIRDPQQLDKLYAALKNTIPLRDQMLAEPDINLMEVFPFFYVDQKLVNISVFTNFFFIFGNSIHTFMIFKLQIQYDFRCRFPDTEEDAFKNEFPQLRPKILAHLNKNNKYIDFLKIYGEGVVEILMVFSSLTRSKLGRNDLEFLIVCSKVCTFMRNHIIYFLN